MALRCVSSLAQRVVGVIQGADEGLTMWLQRVTSLSKNICLYSYVRILSLQSESNDNGNIPQPSASSSYQTV
jgi:hypothetical protein